MSKEQENKHLVRRWFTGFWGKTYTPAIVDELAAPDMLLDYSSALHRERGLSQSIPGKGHKAFGEGPCHGGIRLARRVVMS